MSLQNQKALGPTGSAADHQPISIGHDVQVGASRLPTRIVKKMSSGRKHSTRGVFRARHIFSVKLQYISFTLKKLEVQRTSEC